jgi:hypothetical protein
MINFGTQKKEDVNLLLKINIRSIKMEQVISSVQANALMKQWINSDHQWIDVTTGEKIASYQEAIERCSHLVADCSGQIEKTEAWLPLQTDNSGGIFIVRLIISCTECGNTQIYICLDIDVWGGVCH